MRLLLYFLALGWSGLLSAQLTPPPDTLAAPEKIYRVNPLVSGGVGAVSLLLNDFGFKRLRGKDRLSAEELAALDPKSVLELDRVALRQNLANRQQSETISDRIFQGAILLPFTLFLDRDIRADWIDISLLYLETQSLASVFYYYGAGPTFFNRFRPIAYYEELDILTRNDGNSRNSFYSGHVSTVAVGTFFFAKVYADYHPDLGGWGKATLYVLAAVPPILDTRAQALAYRYRFRGAGGCWLRRADPADTQAVGAQTRKSPGLDRCV